MSLVAFVIRNIIFVLDKRLIRSYLFFFFFFFVYTFFDFYVICLRSVPEYLDQHTYNMDETFIKRMFQINIKKIKGLKFRLAFFYRNLYLFIIYIIFLNSTNNPTVKFTNPLFFFKSNYSLSTGSAFKQTKYLQD